MIRLAQLASQHSFIIEPRIWIMCHSCICKWISQKVKAAYFPSPDEMCELTSQVRLKVVQVLNWCNNWGVVKPPSVPFKQLQALMVDEIIAFSERRQLLVAAPLPPPKPFFSHQSDTGADGAAEHHRNTPFLWVHVPPGSFCRRSRLMAVSLWAPPPEMSY